MKKWLPLILTAIFAAWIVSDMRARPEKTAFNTRDFARLPVLLDGRIQPLDSVAINALLSMQGKRTVRLEDKSRLSAIQWLLDVTMRPEKADDYRVFRVQHPDLEGFLGRRPGQLEYFSFNDLGPKIRELEDQARRAPKEDALRTAYEKDLLHLYRSAVLYVQLKSSLHPESSPHFPTELDMFEKSIEPARAAVRNSTGEDMKNQDLQLAAEFFKRYQDLEMRAHFLAIPPLDPAHRPDDWQNIGKSLLESLKSGSIHPAVRFYAKMSAGYHDDQPAEFNQGLAEYRTWLDQKQFRAELDKGRRESFFNQLEPFYKSMVIYVAALLLGCAFWLNLSEPVRRCAFALLILAFAVHTTGLLFRMFLEGRPPVTNLYSSAIFVGWGAVLLGMILERIYKGGIGIVTAATVGFVTQIIAHHLSLSGDTMEMLRAVLDTNIWLATHVVIITIGYASVFVAGLLAIIYIVRGFFTRSLNEPTAKALYRMVYGITCFATLFSFVGTILGGIWADQSWGRFWGWDPKENGALLIVIWCAVMLHARWGGLVKERGMMAMAVFGNVVTSFSWFGVNMLGVGLHAYGFMDKAFDWLMLFIGTQMALILLTLVPTRFWRSFQSPPGKGPESLGGLTAKHRPVEGPA